MKKKEDREESRRLWHRAHYGILSTPNTEPFDLNALKSFTNNHFSSSEHNMKKCRAERIVSIQSVGIKSNDFYSRPISIMMTESRRIGRAWPTAEQEYLLVHDLRTLPLELNCKGIISTVIHMRNHPAGKSFQLIPSRAAHHSKLLVFSSLFFRFCFADSN